MTDIIAPSYDTSMLKLINSAFDKGNHNGLVNGYSVDKSLSDDNTKVYKKHGDDNVYVLHRQTDLKDPKRRWQDLKSDVAIAFGAEKYDKRFQDAEKKVGDVATAYPDKPIVNVGYSLGGSLANYSGKRNPNVKKIVTFNQGTTPLSDRGSSKAVNHYINGDWISNYGIVGKRGTHVIKPAVYKSNPHHLINFS